MNYNLSNITNLVLVISVSQRLSAVRPGAGLAVPVSRNEAVTWPYRCSVDLLSEVDDLLRDPGELAVALSA